MTRVFLGLVKFYQKTISPDHGFAMRRKRVCRFFPSCSEYAEEAFKKHSALRAVLLIFYRILRCQPFNNGGWDPVK